MKYEEKINEESKDLKISDIYFQNNEGNTKYIHKINNYANNYLSYLMVTRFDPESEDIKECCNRLIEYLENNIKPQKQAGYFDDEENIYYCFLQNNDLNVVIKSEEIRRNIKVIINNPTKEAEKQFDQIAMSLSNYLEENLGKALK